MVKKKIFLQLKNTLKMPNKITFEYTVTLWDDLGNVLIEKHIFKTKCVNQSTAKKRAVKKYPYPYFVELNNTKK